MTVADIEDIYPLSPMQQGLLLHTRLAGPGMYVQQVRFALTGPLDTTRLRAAWQRTVDRHAVLRTGVVWEGLDEPMQVVATGAVLPWAEHDWSALSAADRDARLAGFLADDRRAGFALADPPLLRLTLVRTAPEQHLLVWTTHHLVVDGWTMPLLLTEVAAHYRGDPPPAGRPFRDYIAWQRDADPAEDTAFWRTELAGFTAPSPICRAPDPAAAPDTAPEDAHADQETTLDAATTAALTRAARAAGLTLNTVVQGCWALLLSVYSGQSDVVFGAAVSGRPAALPGADAIVGPFINSLPVRARVDPHAPAADWLRALQARQAKARRYDQASLVDIQAASELPAGTPLFDTLIGVENYPSGATSLTDEVTLTLLGGQFHTHYPLTLLFLPGERLTVQALYDRRRLGETTVATLLRRLTALLAAVAADPRRPVGALSTVDTAERAALLAAAGDPVAAPRRSLVDVWRGACARFAGRTAVEYRDRSLTYAEADALADRVAAAVTNAAVTDAAGSGATVPGATVGVCLERSAELVPALLGVLKAGAAYLPLDPDHPSARLRALAADAGAATVLTTRALAARHPGLAATAVYLDDLPETAAPAVPAPAPGELAYVLYTSGSTGRPKGVEVTHANVVALLDVTTPAYGFTEHDAWTLFHGYGFDFSVWEMWGALAAGGRLVVVAFETSRDPAAFHALLGERGVTVLSQTPSAFRALSAVGPPPPGLRLVVFGGEELRPADTAAWPTADGPRMVNMYGITETTVHVTHQELPAATGRAIGVPLPGVLVHVVDRYGGLAPDGVVGEMYVGGTGVARGYRGRPELTAARFVPDRFTGTGRLYRSGDLARRLPDGTLEFHGRADGQVQLRGFRVEPGEVEAALAAHPAVRDAVVVGAGDHLRAFVVPREENAGPVRRLLARTGDDPTADLPGGATVAIANASETAFMGQEIFADASYLRGGITLPDDACVVDVGANIGLFTLFVAQHCTRPTILALEPMPPLAGLLRDNLALHGIDAHVLPVAAGAAAGTATFAYYRHATVLSGRYADADAERDVVRSFLVGQLAAQGVELDAEVIEELLVDRLRTESYDCPVRPLSAILAEQRIEHVDLLKIDVEKSELDVLAGLTGADFARIDQIVVEVHDTGGRLAEVRTMLTGLGYTVAVHRDPQLADTGLHNVYARRPGLPARPATPPDPVWRGVAAFVADVRAHAARTLPYYMVPEQILARTEIPLTHNGKPDRARLAAEDGPHPEQVPHVAPRTADERAIAAIWTEILGRERVGARDNFFAVGGHSLLATQVVTRIRERLAVDLPLADVFARPTLAGLAEAVTALRDRQGAGQGAGDP